MTEMVSRSWLGNFWRRWPITIVTTTLAIPIASFTYIHLRASPGPTSTSYTAAPNPRKQSTTLPLTQALIVQSVPGKRPRLSGFRRVRVSSKEVDYIAEDVTIRIFTTPGKSQVWRGDNKVDIGDDVTVRYVAAASTAKSTR